MERLRPGPDAVGASAANRSRRSTSSSSPSARARSAPRPVARVITGYSRSFTDPTACTVLAERQVAQGAGVLFDAAGGCGPGTLDVARGAGIWAVGVDRDRSALGPHILTSVVKRSTARSPC